MLRTPSNLELLLHFHVSAEPHPRLDAPAIIEGTKMLLRAGLIKATNTEEVFTTTEKAHVHIKCLLDMPFPVKNWVAYPDRLVKGDS